MPTVLEASTHFRNTKDAVELAAREGRPTDLAWRMAISAYLLQEATMLQAVVDEKLAAARGKQ